MLAFEQDEYLNRLSNVKEKMIKKSIDLLIVTDPANMNYISGYDALSFYTPQALIITLNSDEPVWIGRYQDYMCAVETTWLKNDNIIIYPDKYLWEPKKEHVMDFIADYLKEKDLANKIIGVEMDSYYFTAHWYEKLKTNLPEAIFKDVTYLVNWVRAIKSDREIEYMKKAAKIVANSMDKAIKNIDAGIRECDVAAEITHAQLSGTEEYGGDYPSLVPLMPAGIKTTAPHMTFTDRKYEKNEVVYVEIAGVYKRYHAPMSRTIYIGDPPKRVEETVKIVIEGLNTAIDKVKPGVRCEEIEASWQKTINKYGLEKESRMGYGVGLSYPPVWVEDTFYMRPGDKTELKENMTFHLMPGMWLKEFGVAVTETVRVTEDGHEVLTDFPRKLFTK